MSDEGSGSWSDRLLGGFRKTSDRLSENIAPVGNTRLDDATLDEIEDALIMSDLGPEAAGRVREALREQRFGNDSGNQGGSGSQNGVAQGGTSGSAQGEGA